MPSFKNVREKAFYDRESKDPKIKHLSTKKKFELIDVRYKKSKIEDRKKGKPRESTKEIILESKLTYPERVIADNLEKKGTMPLKELEKRVKSNPNNNKKVSPELPGFDGEYHARGLSGDTFNVVHSFTGPGTNLNKRLERGDEGINDIDKASKLHDIEYESITNKLNKSKGNSYAGLDRAVRKADINYVHDIQKTKDDDYLKSLINKIFKVKMSLEDYRIISPKKFIVRGT